MVNGSKKDFQLVIKCVVPVTKARAVIKVCTIHIINIDYFIEYVLYLKPTHERSAYSSNNTYYKYILFYRLCLIPMPLEFNTKPIH